MLRKQTDQVTHEADLERDVALKRMIRCCRRTKMDTEKDVLGRALYLIYVVFLSEFLERVSRIFSTIVNGILNTRATTPISRVIARRLLMSA